MPGQRPFAGPPGRAHRSRTGRPQRDMPLTPPLATAGTGLDSLACAFRRLGQGFLVGAAARLMPTHRPHRLAIMVFHRVRPVPDPFLSGDPDVKQFAAIMGLVRDRFSPLSLAEGLRGLEQGTLPQRAVCVTFDDGYADNLTVALPVLKQLGIPVTVFIASGYLDGRLMWNDRLAEAIRRLPGDKVDLNEYRFGVHALGEPRERAKLLRDLLGLLKYCPPEFRDVIADDLAARYAPHLRSPMLTRAQVRELRAQGAEIGGHTVTHPILARTAERDAYREIAENKEDLEGLLGERLRFFAYPNGKPMLDFGPRHAQMAKEIGYQAAVSTGQGVATAATDRFQLPRFTPWDRTPTRFGLRLLWNMRRIA